MAMNTNILPTESLQNVGIPGQGIPSQTWQMLANQARTEPLPKDLDAMFDATRGYFTRLKYRTGRYLARARKVMTYDKFYAGMSDANLREAALDFRAMFRTGRDKPVDLLRAMGLIREVAFRKRAEKHYLVQVAG